MLRRLVALGLVSALPGLPAAAQPGDTGSAEHKAARTNFPERIGEFRRGQVFQYDEQGLDIGVNYSLVRPEGRLQVTLYIYPAPPAETGPERDAGCRSAFETADTAIPRNTPSARRLSSSAPPAVPGTVASLSHRSVYAMNLDMGDGEQAVRSELDLYCYVGDRWLVKYRATAPQGLPVEAAIETFIRNSPWPGRRVPDSVAAASPAPSGGGRAR